ncbi:MAG: glycosyltransferase family 2 protein [Dehalococcoidia bacterium]
MTGILPLLVLWPLAAVALASSAYVFGLTGLAAVARLRRRSPDRPLRPRTRFALLIPAHDEEQLIGRLLQSVSELDYPARLLDVYVIADNCTDATEARARAAGGRVLVRDDRERQGKGYALSWALDNISLAGYDAVAMVDADSVLHPNFLREMEAYFADGAQAIQGYYGVLEADSSASTLRAVSFSLMHYVRPLGKTVFGGSCGLKGNGMVFAAELLLAQGWGAFSVVEDAEQHLRLVRDGVTVRFAPEARVYGEMPASLSGARTQNLRWEAGRWSVARRYAPSLLWLALRRRSLVVLDAAVEPLLPPLSVVAVLGLAVGVSGLALGNLSLALAGGIVLAALAAHVAGGMLLSRAPLSAWRSLLTAPVYLPWKVALYAQALLGAGAQRWVRTPRSPTKN